MEYGISMTAGPHDYNDSRFVGWSAASSMSDCLINCYQDLYKQETVNYISKQVTNYLSPLKKNGKLICVPDEQIREMITSVWNVEKVVPAGIYTKDTFDDVGTPNPFRRIVDIVIQSITSQIKDLYEMRECNNSLNIWNQLYGDFNEAGLRAHSKIKLRERHPQYMMFNMNY